MKLCILVLKFQKKDQIKKKKIRLKIFSYRIQQTTNPKKKKLYEKEIVNINRANDWTFDLILYIFCLFVSKQLSNTLTTIDGIN